MKNDEDLNEIFSDSSYWVELIQIAKGYEVKDTQSCDRCYL